MLKDVLLLAGAWLVMADSARALLATWASAAPSRGRTESRLQGAALPINAEGRRNDAVPYEGYPDCHPDGTPQWSLYSSSRRSGR